jgi:hypothetical protein
MSLACRILHPAVPYHNEGHVADIRSSHRRFRLQEEPPMTATGVVDLNKHQFLRAVYELADMRAKLAIAFADAQTRAGHSEFQADEACGFWADRGILEYPSYNKVALTYVGLRRARRMAERGWQPEVPF